MRSFVFTAKNIGRERYLTYTMGEGCELDEDMLDFCEENKLPELINVVFEEDEDYDYLTYDVTGKMTLEKFTAGTMNREKVFHLMRNVALGLIGLKEQGVRLSYVLLHKGFMYINPDSLAIQFICLPIESEGSLSAEFKSFMRQLLANMKYDVEEDLAYVGQLLTYINGDSFNLRGMVGLTEALMEDAGINFEEEAAIATEDGSEVISSTEPEEEESNVSDFMSGLDEADAALPEIGDDEEDEEEEDTIEDSEEAEDVSESTIGETANLKEEETPEAEEETAVESEVEASEPEVEPEAEETAAEPEVSEQEETEAPEEKPEEVVPTKKAESIEDIKARLERIVNGGDEPKPQKRETAESINEDGELDEIIRVTPTIKKTSIKINRAALIQNAAEQEHDDGSVQEVSQASKTAGSTRPSAVEEIDESLNAEASAAQSNSILSKGAATAAPSTAPAIKINPYLVRVDTEERVMITKAVFKIGKANRGVDYKIEGNGAISRQHAVIILKEGVYYIKDNKSTNHTFVNGKRVEDGQEELLTHDCKIRLGDEIFIFKLR